MSTAYTLNTFYMASLGLGHTVINKEMAEQHVTRGERNPGKMWMDKLLPRVRRARKEKDQVQRQGTEVRDGSRNSFRDTMWPPSVLHKAVITHYLFTTIYPE